MKPSSKKENMFLGKHTDIMWVFTSETEHETNIPAVLQL
jgi:hypothetical protein